jgi:hypothetical protein
MDDGSPVPSAGLGTHWLARGLGHRKTSPEPAGRRGRPSTTGPAGPSPSRNKSSNATWCTMQFAPPRGRPRRCRREPLRRSPQALSRPSMPLLELGQDASSEFSGLGSFRATHQETPGPPLRRKPVATHAALFCTAVMGSQRGGRVHDWRADRRSGGDVGGARTGPPDGRRTGSEWEAA